MMTILIRYRCHEHVFSDFEGYGATVHGQQKDGGLRVQVIVYTGCMFLYWVYFWQYVLYDVKKKLNSI